MRTLIQKNLIHLEQGALQTLPSFLEQQQADFNLLIITSGLSVIISNKHLSQTMHLHLTSKLFSFCNISGSCNAVNEKNYFIRTIFVGPLEFVMYVCTSGCECDDHLPFWDAWDSYLL